MPTATLNPTANTNPDQGGTNAVSGASNTGFTSTTTSASASDIESAPPENNSAAKSCKWTTFGAGPSNITALTLKFEWTASGSAIVDTSVAGSGDANASFVVQYSTDGGSNWTNIVNRSVSASAGGGTSDSDSDAPVGTQAASVSLSAAQSISLVQVRARMDASASATAPNLPGAEVSSSASYTATVSSIRLEAVTRDTGLLVMM